MSGFLALRASTHRRIYFVNAPGSSELPAEVTGQKRVNAAPTWLQLLQQKWPSFELVNARQQVYGLMDVQSETEMAAVRLAAKAKVDAFAVGMRVIKPGVAQRVVELAVEGACWKAGAHGSSFWPWAFAGKNPVFPAPFRSVVQYDHLNAVMQAGDLVRLDIGCE